MESALTVDKILVADMRSKYGMAPALTERALAMGHALLTSAEHAHLVSERQAAVTYHLLWDAKRKAEIAAFETQCRLMAASLEDPLFSLSSPLMNLPNSNFPHNSSSTPIYTSTISKPLPSPDVSTLRDPVADTASTDLNISSNNPIKESKAPHSLLRAELLSAKATTDYATFSPGNSNFALISSASSQSRIVDGKGNGFTSARQLGIQVPGSGLGRPGLSALPGFGVGSPSVSAMSSPGSLFLTGSPVLKSFAHPKQARQASFGKDVRGSHIQGVKDNSTWCLGFRSTKTPPEAMGDVYTGLKSLNLDWKPLDLYRLKARFPSRLRAPDGKSVGIADQLYLYVRLYKHKQRFHVDLHRVHGDILLALRICTKLVAYLEARGHRAGLSTYSNHPLGSNETFAPGFNSRGSSSGPGGAGSQGSLFQRDKDDGRAAVSGGSSRNRERSERRASDRPEVSSPRRDVQSDRPPRASSGSSKEILREPSNARGVSSRATYSQTSSSHGDCGD
jgi:hypothetical protein